MRIGCEMCLCFDVCKPCRNLRLICRRGSAWGVYGMLVQRSSLCTASAICDTDRLSALMYRKRKRNASLSHAQTCIRRRHAAVHGSMRFYILWIAGCADVAAVGAWNDRKRMYENKRSR